MPSAIWIRRLAALVSGCAALACAEPGPSILLVTVDTLRKDHVGAYGSEHAATPSLDALAREGLVHDAAYTTMPTTGPAHLSLFTGLYPAEHGARRNGEPLSPESSGRELGVKLRERGYATAAFVTSLLAGPSATGLRGFEIYDAPQGALRHGSDIVEQVLVWLDAEPRRPVFLWVHLYDSHAPYGTPDEKRLSFPVDRSLHGFVDPAKYASDRARREMEERYARGVRSADAALGELVEGIRGRLGDLLVIVVADHGESLSERLAERGFAYDHGKFLDLETVAIPLIVAGAGVSAGRSPGTASIRDLYTTILEASGVGDPQPERQGRRDLRVSSAAPRIVTVERRRFIFEMPDAVRRHAAAAADGARLVVVGEDGSPADTVMAPGADELLRAARGRIPRQATPGAPEQVDPQMRRALEELGYVE